MAKTRIRQDGDPVIIKKYANRRLYDTQRSSYITLDDLGAMVREGREFQVVDAKSEEDITHSVLTQIIMETETRGQTLLPVAFLRQIISLYGDNMQSMVPQYLEESMASFRRNQKQFQDALQGALTGGTLADIARRNMEIFSQAASAFVPGRTAAPAAGPGDKDAEIAALKAEIEALRKAVEAK